MSEMQYTHVVGVNEKCMFCFRGNMCICCTVHSVQEIRKPFCLNGITTVHSNIYGLIKNQSGLSHAFQFWNTHVSEAADEFMFSHLSL